MAKPVAFGAALGVLVLASGCSDQASAPPGNEQTVAFAQASSGRLAHGERISRVLGCVGCHGEDLAGQDWSDELGTLWTANLTQTAARSSDNEITGLITTGKRTDRELLGMPSHLFTQLAPSDMGAVIAFVRSRPRKGDVHPAPTFSPELRAAMNEGKLKTSAQEVVEQGTRSPPDAGTDLALGRYIARATCAECHGMDLRGGKPPLPGDKARPDLRIVASYDPGDFVKLMRTGKAAGNREVSLMSEVARGRYAHLTDAEIGSLRNYLAKVAEIDP